MQTWTTETAFAEIKRLIEQINPLFESYPYSAAHTRWMFATNQFLREVFGEASPYYLSFLQVTWPHQGPMVVLGREAYIPGLAEKRYNAPGSCPIYE